MSVVIKTAKTIRDNWKKSVLAVIASVYGVKFVNRKYEEDLLRRDYCAKAQKYGSVTIKIGEKVRKITVFLNPAASAGGATKLFNKNAAPLLHLAGLEVNLVRTEYEGQVKKFMDVIQKKDTDGIVIAGGDGTLLEAVTGIMRKEDRDFLESIPVGVIPLGYTNRFAKLLFGSDKQQVRFILDSAMAVVQGFAKKMDVLKIQGEDGRSTFAVSGLETGAYKDADVQKQKFWYFGPLKSRWTYLRSCFKDWPPVLRAKVSYVLASEENMKPKYVTKRQEQQQAEVKRSWWNILQLFYRPQMKKPEDLREEVDDNDNEDDEVQEEELTSVEFTLMSPNLKLQNETLSAAEFGVGPEDVTKTDFITEGWRRINDKSLRLGTESNKKLLVKKIKIVPEIPEGSSLWYTIDGEQFEAMPIEVRLLRNRLKVFYNQNLVPS